MGAAASLLGIAEIWAFCGLATAIAFLTFGLERIDESARGAFVFRALLAPGIILIWPIVLWRWAVLISGRDDWTKRSRPPLESHGRVWSVLAWAIPLVFLAALFLTEPPPGDMPATYQPERLSGPGQ